MARSPKSPPKVHNYSTYQNHKCRCEVCKAACAAYQQQRREHYRARRLAAQALGGIFVAPGVTHGVNGWDNFACRCQVCRDAHNAAARSYAARRKESTDAPR